MNTEWRTMYEDIVIALKLIFVVRSNFCLLSHFLLLGVHGSRIHGGCSDIHSCYSEKWCTLCYYTRLFSLSSWRITTVKKKETKSIPFNYSCPNHWTRICPYYSFTLKKKKKTRIFDDDINSKKRNTSSYLGRHHHLIWEGIQILFLHYVIIIIIGDDDELLSCLTSWMTLSLFLPWVL